MHLIRHARSLRLAAILLTSAALLTACQSNPPADPASADASTRPVPEKSPKRPTDIKVPPPPIPGHTSR